MSMEVVRPGSHLVTVTDGGFAKRTSVSEWRTQGRNTFGVTAMKLVEQRGSLVGALICEESDELYAIASNGVVIRTRVDQVRSTGRATMGVSLMDLGPQDSVVGVARAAEINDIEVDIEVEGEVGEEGELRPADAAADEVRPELQDDAEQGSEDDTAPEDDPGNESDQ